MVAGTFERAFGQLFQQLVILGSDAAESFQRLFGFAARIVEVARPGILIEGDQSGIVFG